MTDSPAGPPTGWYPDPSAPPGRTGQRWWDGQAWTEHVVADPPTAPVAVTPDGAPIADVGRRIGAYAIDGLVTGLLSTLLGLPFLLAIFRNAADQFQRSMDAARTGGPPASPSPFSIYDGAFGPLLGCLAVSLAVIVLYNTFFLRWRGATPGKLALGLRVRSWNDPGRLAWGVVLRRLVAQHWYVLLLPIPILGSFAGVWTLVDNLFSLGNPQRRSLHDRFADTVVVDVRSSV